MYVAEVEKVELICFIIVEMIKTPPQLSLYVCCDFE